MIRPVIRSVIRPVVASVTGRLGSQSWDGIFTDGTETWRLIADDDEAFNWQHTLTATGFAGTEDVDYYTPQEIE